MLIRHAGNSNWHIPEILKYQNEEELQTLLAESPSLLPGVEEDGAAAVTELPVEANAIDVVVVETDGEITLVECKLSTNREIRRQVVGQILEYAAGVHEMPYEDFDTRWTSRAKQTLAESAKSASEDLDEEAFRAAVGSSLKQGRFRLIVAVDEIAPELKAIIEFLNRSTWGGLEVLALELGYVKDAEVEVLVPKIYGQEKLSPPGPGHRWTEADLRATALERAESDEAATGLLEIWDWAKGHAHSIVWGSGQSVAASVWFALKDPTPVLLFSVPTTKGPTVQVQFGNIRGHAVPKKVMSSLAERLRSMPGADDQLVGLADADYNKWPSFPANLFFLVAANRTIFIDALMSLIEEAKEASADGAESTGVAIETSESTE